MRLPVFSERSTQGLVAVDDAGFFTLPTVRPKAPLGRYSLLSKNGSGVSLNLEYLIQVGATSELILDHGWPPEAVDFERGEFDALGHDSDGRVCLAMEAKARVSGPDSLEGLLRFWLRALAEPGIDLRNNSGRKLAELRRLCLDGPVIVWLVAEGARWSLWAEMHDDEVVLSPGPAPDLANRHGPTGTDEGASDARVLPVRRHLPPELVLWPPWAGVPNTDSTHARSPRLSRSKTVTTAGSPGAPGRYRN